MTIAYRSYEFSPLMSDTSWQVEIRSGNRFIIKTIVFADRAAALAEAQKYVEFFLSGR
jgi:hypothetical protein